MKTFLFSFLLARHDGKAHIAAVARHENKS
jgi:hypothetical protein